jgi:hypothetical protein
MTEGYVAMGGPFFEAASPATLSRTFVVCAHRIRNDASKEDICCGSGSRKELNKW